MLRGNRHLSANVRPPPVAVGLRDDLFGVGPADENAAAVRPDDFDRHFENPLQQLVQRQRRSDGLFGNAVQGLQVGERLFLLVPRSFARFAGVLRDRADNLRQVVGPIFGDDVDALGDVAGFVVGVGVGEQDDGAAALHLIAAGTSRDRHGLLIYSNGFSLRGGGAGATVCGSAAGRILRSGGSR
jgi:hypothetical protein